MWSPPPSRLCAWLLQRKPGHATPARGAVMAELKAMQLRAWQASLRAAVEAEQGEIMRLTDMQYRKMQAKAAETRNGALRELMRKRWEVTTACYRDAHEAHAVSVDRLDRDAQMRNQRFKGVQKVSCASGAAWQVHCMQRTAAPLPAYLPMVPPPGPARPHTHTCLHKVRMRQRSAPIAALCMSPSPGASAHVHVHTEKLAPLLCPCRCMRAGWPRTSRRAGAWTTRRGAWRRSRPTTLMLTRPCSRSRCGSHGQPCMHACARGCTRTRTRTRTELVGMGHQAVYFSTRVPPKHACSAQLVGPAGWACRVGLQSGKARAHACHLTQGGGPVSLEPKPCS